MPRTRRLSIERELKFSVARGFTLPPLPGAKIPSRVFTSTYYDTDGFQLAQAGLTLRYRTKGRSGSWQLKVPANRARLEVEYQGRPVGPPVALTNLLYAHLRGTKVKPVARLRTHRTGVRMRGRGGFVADLTLDSVDVLSRGKAVRHFDEVEAELIRGDEKALRKIEKLLRKAGVRTSDQRPKVFQALGLAFPLPESASARARSPIACLKALMKEQVRQVLSHDIGVRLGTNAEDVHRMRVAIRRLRALLRAARSMLAAKWAEDLRDELRWLGDALGRVRDLDVLLGHLLEERSGLLLSERRGLSRVLGALRHERAARREALLTALQSDRYLALLRRVEAAADSPVVVNPDVSLETIAKAEFKKLRKAVRIGGAQPSNAALHRIRIKGKRARYTAELVAARNGRAPARFIRRITALQDLLGEHHDAVVAERRLRRLLAAHPDRRTARALRLLIGRQGERRRKARKQWPRTWSNVDA